MARIGDYELLTPMRTVGSGSARWCIARRAGIRFFMKQFLSPVAPPESGAAALIQKQQDRCEAFEGQKQRLYTALSCVIGDTLVPVLDFFCYERRYYAISEEIPKPHRTGEDTASLGLRERREILYHLALCLQRLHLQGVVHADLKPEHVLLQPKAGGGFRTRLIDLDSGFLADEPPTAQRDMEGDPVYLAPEAFLRMIGQEAELGPALDTFAFGAMIHRLWVGTLPEFDRDRYTYLYEAALDGGTIRLSPELPLPYRMLTRRMLHKEPSERPTDAEIVDLLSTPYRPEKEKPLANGLKRLWRG